MVVIIDKAKMATLYDEHIYMQKDEDLKAVRILHASMSLPGCVESV
jgi:hypothetical protein